MHEIGDGTLTLKLRCGNHSEHLITISIIQIFGLDYLANLFATTKFFNVNGHFLRLLQSPARFVEKPGAVVVIQGDPPEECTQYIQHAMQYLRRCWAMGHYEAAQD